MSRLRLCLASLLLASGISANGAMASANDPAHRIGPDVTMIRPDLRVATVRDQVKAKLAERRALTIEHFIAYREGRVYPVNNLGLGARNHIWLDEFGNLCAAATLISYDWGRAATEKVGAKNNGIALAKVKSGAVMDWILTSGLTHGEIVAIQLPPMDVEWRQQNRETERLYTMYIDVERQLNDMGEQNLDLAVDRLMKRADLVKELLAGRSAGPGAFAVPVATPEPMPEPMPTPKPEDFLMGQRFAVPPPGK